MKSISDELAVEILEFAKQGLCEYDYYDNGSDYQCHFCFSRSVSNVDLTIEHDENCFGLRVIKELEK